MKIRTPGVYGLPSVNRGYSQVIRATPNLVTFWPGKFSSQATSVANYAMPTAAWSMECWVNITTLGTNVGLLSNYASNNGPVLWLDATVGRFGFHVNTVDMDSGILPVANAWYYLVGTYDGTSRSIYVNGSKMAGPTSGVTPAASSTPLITHNYAGSGNGGLSGSVADVAIYSRALTSGENVAHYDAGLPRT